MKSSRASQLTSPRSRAGRAWRHRVPRVVRAFIRCTDASASPRWTVYAVALRLAVSSCAPRPRREPRKARATRRVQERPRLRPAHAERHLAASCWHSHLHTTSCRTTFSASSTSSCSGRRETEHAVAIDATAELPSPALLASPALPPVRLNLPNTAASQLVRQGRAGAEQGRPQRTLEARSAGGAWRDCPWPNFHRNSSCTGAQWLLGLLPGRFRQRAAACELLLAGEDYIAAIWFFSGFPV
jgi:hypothetical protein